MTDEEMTLALRKAATQLSVLLEIASDMGLDCQVHTVRFLDPAPTMRRGVTVDVKRLKPYERRPSREYFFPMYT